MKGGSGGGWRRRLVPPVALALWLGLLHWTGAAAVMPPADSDPLAPVAQRLQAKLGAEGTGRRFTCRGEMICGTSLLPEFYSGRGYRPAWIDPAGPRPEAFELLESIRGLGAVGLNPGDYHLAPLAGLLEHSRAAVPPDIDAAAELWSDLDLLLTDAFLLMGAHLVGGRVNPETIHSEWVAMTHEVDLVAALNGALAAGRLADTLAGFTPSHGGYAGMQGYLEHYRQLAAEGGWPAMPEGPSLHPGDREAAVEVLRRRLAATGDLPSPETDDPAFFDGALEAALRAFQERHGLEADGVAGHATRKALNVPAGERVRQIEINMERWRWVPQDLGRRHLLINIADFTLTAVEDGREVLRMPVVVGRPYRRTPVFSGAMTYLELNPYWNVPHKLAVKDILPKVQDDPAYLAREGFEVFASWEADAPPLDPAGIDWAGMTPERFRYRLRQAPGPLNALGRIKFMFPNKFAVYLHDTPARQLFQRPARLYSSGCIRVAAPLDLAAFVMEGSGEWNRAALEAAVAAGNRRVVHLPEAVPVHLLYWTAWVGPDGRLQFREDVYRRDPALERALQERQPQAPSA